MIEISEVRDFVEEYLKDGEMFLLEVKVVGANDIEVVVDSDDSVSVEECAKLNRALQAELEKSEEDFALTISSAGIGQPLKVFRQYKKLIGRPVEVVLKNGVKVLAQLKDATENGLILTYQELEEVDGKKRKQLVDKELSYKLEEIKSTVEHLDYK